ncbi:MAG: hypothetical protein AAFQ61_09060 [Cyanobacteria bacterium J06626_23]
MKWKLYRLFSLIALTALLIAGGGTISNAISPNNNIVQVAQAEDSSAAVTQTTLDYLLADATDPAQQPEVIRTVVVGDFALATWHWGETAGQTVLAEVDTIWQVLISGGGAVDVSTLIEVGVPADIAQQLIEQDAAGGTP